MSEENYLDPYAKCRPLPSKQKENVVETKHQPGTKVNYHPIIGEESDGNVCEIRAIGDLAHRENVAWLKGKAGCVCLDALSLPEESKFTKESIAKDFTENNKMKVVFIKKDGSERTMICTRDNETIPKDHRPKDRGQTDRPGKPAPSHLFSVFDLENNGWRSFIIGKVISIEPVN